MIVITLRTLVVIEPQRYNFLSKSQQRYADDTRRDVVIEPQRYNFLSKSQRTARRCTVTKVVIEPQRYNFLSKSQPSGFISFSGNCCYWTTKIQFSKQITTESDDVAKIVRLLLNHKDTIF